MEQESKHTETNPFKSGNNWPDAARLKMVEKSEFYQEPKIYQFGFYDGYQLACNNHYLLLEALKEAHKELEYRGSENSKAGNMILEAIKNCEGK